MHGRTCRSARSSTSTWTRSTRRSSSAMIPSCAGKPVAVGTAPSAASSRRRATRPARSACARRCRRRRRCGNVPNSFSCRRASRSIAPCREQIRAIFAEYTPLIEPLSLDEAYLDVTEQSARHADGVRYRARDPCTHLRRDRPHRIGRHFLQQVLGQAGVRHRKPNGQFVITPEMGEEFIESLPVEKFHGVGPVTAEKMHALGIHTGADLKRKSLAFLQQHFGKSGAWYYTIARGRGRPAAWMPNRPRKSSGSETTFSEDLTSTGRNRSRRHRDGRRCVGLVREEPEALVRPSP